MPYSDAFTVGKDFTLNVVDPLTGALRSFQVIVTTQIAFQNKELESIGMDGVVRRAHLPQGGTITITMDRNDSQLWDWWAAYTAAYRTGSRLPQCFIGCVIREPSGAVTEYRFENVSLSVEDLGTFSGDEKVQQTISARFGNFVKVQ